MRTGPPRGGPAAAAGTRAAPDGGAGAGAGGDAGAEAGGETGGAEEPPPPRVRGAGHTGWAGGAGGRAARPIPLARVVGARTAPAQCLRSRAWRLCSLGGHGAGRSPRPGSCPWTRTSSKTLRRPRRSPPGGQSALRRGPGTGREATWRAGLRWRAGRTTSRRALVEGGPNCRTVYSAKGACRRGRVVGVLAVGPAAGVTGAELGPRHPVHDGHYRHLLGDDAGPGPGWPGPPGWSRRGNPCTGRGRRPRRRRCCGRWPCRGARSRRRRPCPLPAGPGRASSRTCNKGWAAGAGQHGGVEIAPAQVGAQLPGRAARAGRQTRRPAAVRK